MIASLPTGTPAEILVLLASHTVPVTAEFVATRLGRNLSTVGNALLRLHMAGHVTRKLTGGRYRYELSEAVRERLQGDSPFAVGFAVRRAA